MHPSDLVLRFLESVGRPAEAEFYLRAFRAERRQSFATIAVSDSAMRIAPDALAVDLRFLSRLGLAPVLVFGLVSPENARAHASAIHERLEGEVPCAIASPEEAGEVAAGGSIPLVPLGDPPGRSEAAHHRRFSALAELATRLECRKLVFVGRRSGFQRASGEYISLVDVKSEGDALLRPGALPPKQAALLEQITRILEVVPHRMTCAVTSPLELLRELFTERGAGTLLRRGASIALYRSMEDIDPERFRALLVSAFERSPLPSIFEKSVETIYVADDYRGAVVVTRAPLGPYLSKFAVDPAARGEGVGRDLWRALTRDIPSFFWRSRWENPFTSWYLRNCDGMARAGPWCVFWRGMPHARILEAIEYAQSAPEDFADSE